MDTMLRNQFLRTVLALCRLAARAQADDVREDVAGECADALEVWTANASDTRIKHLHRWCDNIAVLIERLQGQPGVDPAVLARSHVMLLRLRAQLPHDTERTTPAKAARAAVEAASDKRKPTETRMQVLEAITAATEIRARDLLDRFKGTIAPRTVKRALAELTADGLIERVEHEDRSVSYRPAS